MKKRIVAFLMAIVISFGVLPVLSSSIFAYEIGYDGMGPKVITGGQRDFKWPVPGYYNLQSCFYDHRNHCAIDISANQGTSIVASYDGTVVKVVDGGTSYYGDGFGNYVVVKHNYKTLYGTTITLYSRYNHMYSTSVSEGAQVKRGETVLGKVGQTGKTEGPHLDFQICYGGWSPYQTYSIDPYANDLLELPSNLVVYDSWACGPAYLALVKEQYATPLNFTPTGVVDSISGDVNCIHIRGWAFDSDCPSAQLWIHVYIGGECQQVVCANTYRPDVNSVYGVGDYHGYEATIATAKSGAQEVAIYAINVDKNGNDAGYGHTLLGSKTVTITAHTHSYTSSVTKEPTCTSTGINTFTCSCGNSYTETIAAFGHAFGNWVTSAAPTCTTAGEKKRTCTRNGCGYTEKVSIPATGHQYTSETVSGTCTSYAGIKYTCTACGDSYMKYDDSLYSAWSTSYPTGTDKDLIQSKTEYRYRDKVYKTSSEPSMTGWELYDTVGAWSAWSSWSSWSDNPVYESDSVSVKTQTVYPYYYFYCTTCGTGARYPYYGGTCEICGNKTIPSSTGTVVWYTSPWSNSVQWGSAAKYYQYIDGGIVWNWTDGASKTQYSYRTRTYEYTYYFWSWGSWSSWGETKYDKTDSREVETRILYRYISGSLNEHKWGTPEVVAQATCTEQGVVKYTCEVCGATKEEKTSALGHSYKDTVTAPTCTAQGYTTHTCSGCGDSYVDTYTAPIGHNWDSGIVTTQPTETSEGVKTFTCTRCGATRTETVPALSHTHSYTSVVTAPTCTEKGFTTYTCTCGDSYKDSYTDALGHNWDSGVITTQPTETSEGVKTFTCSRCGETRTETVPATGDSSDCGGNAASCPSAKFTDVAPYGDWSHNGIDFCLDRGLFGGTSATTFEPNTAMNRAMLVTVLWRYQGSPKGYSNDFRDVVNGEWYADAVSWAAANGIVNGVEDGRFDPDGIVTREQMATILYRYSDWRGFNTSKQADFSSFPDAGKVGSWAKTAMQWAVAEGLIGGSQEGGKTYILPGNGATRAQVATILMRFIQNIAEK